MSDNKLGHEALKASSLRRWRVEFEDLCYGTQYVWASTIRHARTWARNIYRAENDPEGDGPGEAIIEIVEVSRNEFTEDDLVLLEEGIEESSLETEVTLITRKTFEILLNKLYVAGGFANRTDFLIACSSPEAFSSSPGIVDWLFGWAPKGPETP